MKYLFTTLFFVSLIFTGYGQKTYVPDDNFEQELIDLGYDDVLDDSVLTSSVDEVPILILSELDISDLTGIEAFSTMYLLDCDMNNLDTLPLGSNTALKFLYCFGNNINDVDLSSNVLMHRLHCSGNEMDELDLTDLVNLVDIDVYDNNLTDLDFSNCPELTVVNVGVNQFTHLDFSNNPILQYFECTDNNELIYLSLKNGNNEIMDTYNSTLCPLLNCIEVDDPAYSETNWLDIDPSVSFSTNCGLGLELNANLQISIYPNPSSNIVNIEILADQMNYKLMDLSGKQIAIGILSKGLNSLDVSTLPAGIYFIEVKGEGYVTPLKIIIQ